MATIATDRVRTAGIAAVSTPPAPPLARDEVHLWLAALDAPRAALAEWRSTLADDELARAARFRAPGDRARFVAGRGILRQLLARYTGQAPAALRFRYPCACGNPTCVPERRKPALGESGGAPVPTFNLSHADDFALYAIGRERPVGVDIERVRADLSLPELARGVLCAGERAALAGLSADRWRDAFFALWTAKEAYLKACGVGLSLPPDQVEVALRDGVPVGFRSIGGSQAEAAHWTLRAFRPAPGYVGALVALGRITAMPLFALGAVASVASDRARASSR